MKVIFLDMDGVLNNYATQVKHHDQYVPFYSDLDPKCMAIFEKILQAKPDYQIMIHSAWREDMSPMQFREIFTELGYDTIAKKILGVTDPATSKQESILETIQLMRVKDFIVIDDDVLWDLGTEMYPRQYKTSLFTGLTVRDMERIVNMMA